MAHSKSSTKAATGFSAASKPRRSKQALLVPRHDTPPSLIKNPPLSTASLLPLVDVGSVAFERLCSDVLQAAHSEVQYRALKRTSGARQFGVDVEGFDADHAPAVVISCKCYKEVLPRHLPVWVEDFTKHIDGHWSGKQVKHFILAVTHDGNDDDLNDAWRDQVAILKKIGITGHLWNTVRITDLLRKDAGLVRRYFNPVWAEAITASPSDTTPAVTQQKHGNSGVDLYQQLGAFAAQIDGATRSKLEAALSESRAGRPVALTKCLDEAIDDPSAWAVLNSETKARLLRTKAIAKLQANDTTAARDLLSDADGFAPAPDNVARALIAGVESGIVSGLGLLNPPRTVREREVAAGWQIQLNDPTTALSTLAAIQGDDVTAEVLRLRAIAEFVLGHRAQALRLAKSAVMKAPGEALSRLTWAVCKIMSSLTAGAEPQFGTAPNPISAALVRGTGDAKALLDEAITELESLVATTDNPLRTDLEVWRFAALLLHPDRRTEARAYGQSLLRRPNPDPAAVAWALHYRISVRIGSLRKHYIDLLRTGGGDPSYVAILALLTAHAKGAEAALAVIEQHAPNYPNDAEFFQGWRTNFGATSSGGTFNDLMQAALLSQDFKALADFLAQNEVYAAEILAASEVLASKKQWELLDFLRDKLTLLGIERAFALAMMAALNTKAPTAAVEIADLGSRSFDNGRLPRNLVFLRIRAREELGQHAPVIADLQTLLSEKEDAELRRKLISTYLQIGAYGDVGTELERMLAEPEADRQQVLALAHAVRAYSPDLARRAVLLVGQGTDTPSPEMASALLSLAAELGLAEIQSRMMPLVIASADQPSSPVRSFSEQEILEFIQHDIDDSRAKYDQWLQGNTPGVLGLDQATIVRLYLSPREQRRLPLGEDIPMLLRSASLDDVRVPQATDASVLCLDLTGLLLADRLGILPTVEAVFSLQVPPSLAEALSQLEGKFQKPDRQVIETIRNVFASSSRTLEVVPSLPEGLITLDSRNDDSPNDLDLGVIHGLLVQCFNDGHLTRDKLNAAMALAGIDAAEMPTLDTPAKGICLDSNNIAQVARLGILPAFCLAFDVKIAQSQADVIKRQIDAAEHNGELRDRLTSIRQLVSERLKAGNWHTIPSHQAEFENPIDHLPPQIRCLMESLASAKGGSLTWIEDRAISHSATPGVVGVYGVVGALVRAGAIDESRRHNLARSLRELGYCFAPIELEAIVADIMAAPVDDDQVTETADLASWRIWFAEETARLQYIRKDLVQDREGRVAGELRRVLALGALARDILARIWQSDEADRAKRLRSEWVWTALRAEQFPALGDEGEASAKRQNAILTIAHILDIPFHLALNQAPMAKAAGQGFAQWLTSSVLDTIERVDPDFANEVAQVIADMLGSVLKEDPELSADERAQVFNLFSKLVNDYLALLPLKWRTRISDRVPSELGRTRAMVMSLGNGNTIVAADFCRAFAETLTSDSSTSPAATVKLANGKSARLKSTGDSSKLTVTVEIGKKSYEIDDLTLALSHPNEADRRSLIKALPELSEGYSFISVQDWDQVVTVADADERFARAERLLDSDLWRSLGNLEQRFNAGKPINIEDLDLPTPAAVAKFLGVSDNLKDLEQIWECHENLIRQVGFDEALIRFASLPILVSPANRDQLRVSAQEASKKIDWDQRPFFALLRHSFFLRNGIDVETDDDLMVKVARAVEDGSVELFSALLRLYGRNAAFLPDWQALVPQVRVTLIWTYAMAILRIFNAPSDDLIKIASVVSGNVPDSLMDQTAIASMEPWERGVTAELTSIQARAVFVGDLSKSGVSIPKGSTSDLLGRDAENGWVPAWDLLFPPAAAPATFWVGMDTMVALIDLGWLDEKSEFATRDEDLLTAKVLESAGSNEQPFVLPALLSIVDVDRVSSETLGRMRVAIAEANGEASVEPDRLVMHRLLSARAAVYGKLGDVDGFHGDLMKTARACCERWPNARLKSHPKIEEAGAAFAILEKAAVLHASRLPFGPDRKFETLAVSIEAISKGWPGSAKAAIASLDEHSRQASGQGSTAMWTSILRQRCAK